jgi:antitoxin PrlF
MVMGNTFLKLTVKGDQMGTTKLPISSLTSKFQATIPAEVRAKLQLLAGDKIHFTFNKSGEVILKKLSKTDVSYLKSIEQTLSEWNSPEDEEAFGDL